MSNTNERVEGAQALGGVIGYWLLVCAHLPSHQRNSHEIRARSNNLRNRDLVLRSFAAIRIRGVRISRISSSSDDVVTAQYLSQGQGQGQGQGWCEAQSFPICTRAVSGIWYLVYCTSPIAYPIVNGYSPSGTWGPRTSTGGPRRRRRQEKK